MVGLLTTIVLITFLFLAFEPASTRRRTPEQLKYNVGDVVEVQVGHAWMNNWKTATVDTIVKNGLDNDTYTLTFDDAEVNARQQNTWSATCLRALKVKSVDSYTMDTRLWKKGQDMRIMLIGIQGAGKGTQAKKLATKYGLVHVSSGDLLRAEIAAGTELGKTFKTAVDTGNLAPSAIVSGMVLEMLKYLIECNRGFILDGYPRTEDQAESLKEFLKKDGGSTGLRTGGCKPLTAVIELHLSDQDAKDRCASRYLIEHRKDDTPAKVETRLGEYHAQTEKTMNDKYASKELFTSIEANQSPKDVEKEIDTFLTKFHGLDNLPKKTTAKIIDVIQLMAAQRLQEAETKLEEAVAAAGEAQ